MKKVLFYSIALVVMIATAACSKNELGSDPEIKGQTIKVKIRGGVAETRTGVKYEDGAYYPYWNEGDKISVFFDDFESKNKPDATLTNVNSKGETADFSGEITLANGTTIGEEGRILSFYPASAFQTDGVISSEESVRLNLKTSQEPAADSYDPAADILVGQPSDYMYDDGYLYADIAFARVMSVVKVTLKAAGDCPANIAVNKLTMTAPDGAVLTGRSKVSLAALYGTDSPVGEWTVKNNEVSALYRGDFHPVIGGSENTVYLIVNPTTIASGSQVTFTMESDNYNISKTVTLGKALAFPQGNVANINLTIANENCTPVVVETRILVEPFKNEPEDNKEQMTPSQTGVTGTGVSENLEYAYSTTNTNIRMGTNGQSSTNPYLWISGANQYMTLSNIVLNNETALKFSFVTKTTQGSATVTVKYKESSSDTWLEAGTGESALSSWQTRSIIFNVASSVTSLDLQIVGSAGSLMVDDLVLEKFVDTRVKLADPTNITAALDGETPNKINVSWTAVEHADKYEVVLSASDEEDVVLNPDENSASATGLAYEKEYSIKVKAVTTNLENYIDSDYANASSTVTTGAKPEGEAEWVKTDFASLTNGSQVVIVSTNSSNVSYAMSNGNGTTSAPAAVSIAFTNNKLNSTPDTNIVWFVGVDNGNVTFYSKQDNTAWLYCTSTNNGVRVGTNTAKTFTYDNNYLKHVGTSRYLGVYNSADWRCYTDYTQANIANQVTTFYVRTGEPGPEPEPATLESISVKKAPTKVTYTEGDKFEPAGLVITKHMSDGTTEDVTYSDSNKSEFTFDPSVDTALQTSNTSVTITYGGKSTTQDITVNSQVGPTPGGSTTVSVTLSSKGYSNGAVVSNVTLDSNVTATFAKGTGSNDPKYYTSGTAVRCYGGNTITINAGSKTITGITLTYGSSDGSNAITASPGTFSTPSWTGTSSSVVFTIGGSSGNRRIAGIEVTYQ